jgi:hypothetical protein
MKWVCVTKDWKGFTYGKTYEGELNGTLLDVPDDTGYRSHPSLFRKSINKKPPTEKVYYFLTLEEWREKQINEIIK